MAEMKFETKAVHAGIEPDPSTGAIMTPIYQTSTYVQDAPGKHKGYEYGRTQNPTRTALEKNLAGLENGEQGLVFSSGLAAMDAVMKLLDPGDEVISTNDLYGGSYRQMVQIYARYGIKSHFVDLNDKSILKGLINDRTRLIWIETPTNPMLQIVDIRDVCRTVAKRDILTCVDNTFASPFLQTPLDLGADIVLHSATKYLAGHSDVILGALVCKSAQIAEKLGFLQNAIGAVPGPQDCFLTLRGIKTLHLRVQRASDNATEIAAFLKKNRKVDKVYYPGFIDFPNHHVAKRQMRHYGAMVSFSLKNDSKRAANRIMSRTNLFSLAESLGGVESLIGHPASMTHASIPKKERLQIGMTDSLMRLSVGIEHVDDLIMDLREALK
ncbi:MAG: PLP-dependent aspartate aminotransferase family protein [Saprospiraceae bacterium]|nr:PLP-dependent aspartate aminotransferase family protein [Saprospiraceae bacterium]